MCDHRHIQLMGQIAVDKHKTVKLYCCAECRSTVVLHDKQIRTADYREFR